MPFTDLFAIAIQKLAAEFYYTRVFDLQKGIADQEADQQARQIPGTGSQGRLIEVGDVEVHEPVVAFVATEILPVQVATDPGGRRCV